ncbi:Gypsy retrotransposon integrase-like protein 1 [Nymphon striatum]|nr:Gypsy retrotransposon integrase-like protein 1 [Nymphon striatum]
MQIRPRYKTDQDSISEFISYFDRLVAANEWNDVKAGLYFPTLLECNSRFHSKIESLSASDRKSYASIKKAILAEEEPYRTSNCMKLLNLKMETGSISGRISGTILDIQEYCKKSYRFCVTGRSCKLYNFDKITLGEGDKIRSKTVGETSRIVVMSPLKCYTCGEVGHLARFCSRKKPQIYSPRSEDKPVHNISVTCDNRFYVQGKINGKEENILIDSGASPIVIPSSRYFPDRQTNVMCTLANGDPLEVVGASEVKIEIGEVTSKEMCYIANVSVPLIGAEFLRKHGAVIDAKGTLFFGKMNSSIKMITNEINEEDIEAQAQEFLEVVFAEDLSPLVNNISVPQRKPRELDKILSNKDVQGKRGRMALRLTEFDGMEISHIKGKYNADADAISRCEVNAVEKIFPCDDVMRTAIEKQPRSFKKIAGNHYFCENGQEDRLCVPQKEVRNILINCHDNLGHLGIHRTLSTIRKRFYWPKLRQDVKNWVKKCKMCSIQKDLLPTLLQHRWWRLEDILEPFQKIAIDILWTSIPKQTMETDVVCKMREVREEVRKNLKKSSVATKKAYDNSKARENSELQVGDRVLWKKLVKKKGLSPKLVKRWHGPFEIVGKLSDVNFQLMGTNRNTTIVHSNYLKKCEFDAPLEVIRSRGRPKK